MERRNGGGTLVRVRADDLPVLFVSYFPFSGVNVTTSNRSRSVVRLNDEISVLSRVGCSRLDESVGYLSDSSSFFHSKKSVTQSPQ